MKSLIFRIILLGFIGCISSGCPLSMEVFYPKLKLVNQSDLRIKTFLNTAHPDSSLKRSIGDKYLDPKTDTYVGDFVNLERRNGITLFIFDHAYFKSRWHERAGTPDRYLEEDKILKKFYHSREELDSLGWRLVYP